MARPAKPRTFSRASLYELVWSSPLGDVADRLGMSANGVAKLCDRLGVPRPPRAYWNLPVALQRKDPLPAPPAGVDDRVVIGDNAARRPRTRLPLHERQAQLLDEAARLALEDGLSEVTLKRVAGLAGITEAQAHNCFATRLDLLLALARREIGAVERGRRTRVARGDDVFANVVISTISYLHEAKERGPLLQALLRNPEVRKGLQAERATAVAAAREPILMRLSTQNGMTRSAANASTAALTAVCLRAGGMVASRRLDLATAERLCLRIVMAGVRVNQGALADETSGSP